MPLMRFFLWVFSFCFFCQGLSLAFAQEKVNQLEEVNIVFEKNKASQTGFFVVEQDSLLLRQGFLSSLDRALFNLPSVSIRTYGVGNISGISVRGGSTAQTAVVWNGINLQSQFNGMADLSTIGNLDNHTIQMQLGGSAGLVGSGAIAGSLFINPNTIYDSIHQLNVSFQTYDFNQRATQANYKVGNDKIQLFVAPYAQWGQNNYRFRSAENQPLLRQTHGNLNWIGQNTGLSIKLKPKTKLAFHSWMQDAQRLVPHPAHLSSTASQTDFFSRNLMCLEHSFNPKFNIGIRLANLQEKLLYEDKPKNIHSPFALNQWLIENDLLYKFYPTHSVSLSTHFSETRGSNVNHTNGSNRRTRKAAFITYKFNLLKRLELSASTAFEMNNQTQSPLSPSLGMNIKLVKNLWLKGNMSQTYRMPTFNDLFWKEGGNETLKPEMGWGKELGLEYVKTMHQYFRFQLVSQVYHRKVKNWLAWQPENGVWTASNIQAVESYGLDNRVQLFFSKSKLTVNATFWHAFNSTKRLNDNLSGKYLIYVPPYSYGTNLSISYGKFTCLVQQNYQSWRFLTADNSDFLDPFTVWNLVLNTNLKSARCFVEVNNLFNQQYETVANYPMPLRHARFGLMLTIDNNLFKSKSLTNENP